MALSPAVYREAPVGIEPTNRGFADLCLTTWLRRRAMQGLNLPRQGLPENPRGRYGKNVEWMEKVSDEQYRR